MLARQKIEQPISGELILAEFSVLRIMLLLMLFISFLIGFMIVPMWDISITVSHLNQRPIFRYFEEIFCIIGILMFGILLFRALFISRIAIYIFDQRLFWVLPFGATDIGLMQISSLSRWILPGIIVIKRSGGGRNYIASSVTRLSSSELISQITKARQKGLEIHRTPSAT